jgi:hypothetical protein
MTSLKIVLWTGIRSHKRQQIQKKGQKNNDIQKEEDAQKHSPAETAVTNRLLRPRQRPHHYEQKGNTEVPWPALATINRVSKKSLPSDPHRQ